MTAYSISSLALHLPLACVLFFAVNWIGKHAIDFGYSSTTLFEDTSDSFALNFFLRALSPAVFIVAISAFMVAFGFATFRIGIYWVVVYYYLIRCAVIVLLNRGQLVSWRRFLIHTFFGMGFAFLAYRYLIVPKISLLPNIEDMGNELWLAIMAFLYAVVNKVPVADGPGPKRRNNFIRTHLDSGRRKFGDLIDEHVEDEKLRLIVYAILVYEDYARPAGIRALERCMFWKPNRTTGIMQVKSMGVLSDVESVSKGIALLKESWASHIKEDDYERVRATIADYNADNDYIYKVHEVMEVIAKRIDTSFRSTYEEIFRY